jgi:hypothetical protein
MSPKWLLEHFISVYELPLCRYACNAETKQAKGLQAGGPSSWKVLGGARCGVHVHVVIGMLLPHALLASLNIIRCSSLEKEEAGEQVNRRLIASLAVSDHRESVLPRRGFLVYSFRHMLLCIIHHDQIHSRAIASHRKPLHKIYLSTSKLRTFFPCFRLSTTYSN